MSTQTTRTDTSAPLCLVRSSINIDETFLVPHIVRPGETISSSRLVSRAGGKGANVAAALGLAGAPVALCAAVGHDADWPVEELRRRNVDVRGVERLEDVPTGRAFIQIAQDGENSIVLLKGANFHQAQGSASSDPERAFAALGQPPTHLVLQNEIPLDVTRAFLRHGRRQGCLTVVNPSPMPERAHLRDFDWADVDVLVVNQGEAEELLDALGETSERRQPSPPASAATAAAKEEAAASASSSAPPHEHRSAEEVLSALDALESLAPLKWLVMTLGARGVQAMVRTSSAAPVPSSSSSSSAAAAKVAGDGRLGGARTRFVVPAARPRRILDTTGAGDTFAGNLVAAIMSHEAQLSTGAAPPATQPPPPPSPSPSAVAAAAATTAAAAAPHLERGLLDEREVERALRWASQAAAMAVEKEGALESIPARADVEQRLQSG